MNGLETKIDANLDFRSEVLLGLATPNADSLSQNLRLQKKYFAAL